MRVTSWWIHLPLGLAIWIAVHAGGVHATAAGVAIGLLLRGTRDTLPDGTVEKQSPGEVVEHTIRPFSAGFCVPMFALASAGVSLTGGTLADVFKDRIPLAIAAGLFFGKAIGVFSGAYLTARFTRAELSDDLQWLDIAAISALAGVGFTVSLLIAELGFNDDEHLLTLAKAGVLLGSLISAAVAAVLLRRRDRFYDQLCLDEECDPA
jgi:NhaA family Na+:H+ antiporter